MQEDLGIIKEALQSDDDSLVMNTLDKIKNIYDESFISPCVDLLLHHKNPFVRLKSTEVLQNFNDPRILEALLIATNDEDRFVRGFVAKLLGQYEDERAEMKLKEMLNDSSGFVVDFAQKSLKTLEFKLKIQKIKARV